MKAFDFKLARLTRVRSIQEDHAKGLWQQAHTQLLEAEACLARGKARMLGALEYLRNLQAQQALAPEHVLSARRSIELLEQMQQLELRRVEDARARDDQARQAWTAARVEHESLKRLEQKARTNFRLERDRNEAKELDEVAGLRAARLKGRSA